MQDYEFDMAFDLQESIKTLFTKQWLEQLAQRTGEDVSCLQTAMNIANAATACHILLRTRQPQKQLGIHRMAKVAAGSSLSKELTHLFNGSSHLQGILNMTRIVLGEEYRTIEKQMLEHSKLNEATIRGLLQVCVPGMLSIVGSRIASRKLNPEGFAAFMESLSTDLPNLIPPGVQLPLAQWEKDAKRQAVPRRSAPKAARKKTDVFNLFGQLKWNLLLVAGLVFVVLFFLLK